MAHGVHPVQNPCLEHSEPHLPLKEIKIQQCCSGLSNKNHPPIHLYPLLPIRSYGGLLEPILAVFVQKAGFTLDGSPFHSRSTCTTLKAEPLKVSHSLHQHLQDRGFRSGFPLLCRAAAEHMSLIYHVLNSIPIQINHPTKLVPGVTYGIV